MLMKEYKLKFLLMITTKLNHFRLKESQMIRMIKITKNIHTSVSNGCRIEDPQNPICLRMCS